MIVALKTIPCWLHSWKTQAFLALKTSPKIWTLFTYLMCVLFCFMKAQSSSLICQAIWPLLERDATSAIQNILGLYASLTHYFCIPRFLSWAIMGRWEDKGYRKAAQQIGNKEEKIRYPCWSLKLYNCLQLYYLSESILEQSFIENAKHNKVGLCFTAKFQRRILLFTMWLTK